MNNNSNLVLNRMPAVKDYFVEVTTGNIPGTTAVHKFGVNADVDAGITEDIWNGGGAYTGFDCVAAEILEVFSSSANDVGTLISSGTSTGGSQITLVDAGATFITDGVSIGDIILNDTDLFEGFVSEVTSETTLTVNIFNSITEVIVSFELGKAYRVVTPASTGAAVIQIIQLLDSNFDNETSEYIILNGLTAVDSVGEYIRHSRGAVCIAGTSGSNEGSITTRQKITTANITMVMPIGFNQSMICAYTIPAGKRAFILDWNVSLSSKTTAQVSTRFKTKERLGVMRVKEVLAIVGAGSSSVNREYHVPKNSINPMTDITIDANSDTNNTGVAGAFDLILFDI